MSDHLPLLRISISALTTIQSLSAGVFNTFLIVHLTSPLAALVAPSRLAEHAASRWMVLGRVWYQGEWGEGIIVWGALGAHVISGIAIRLLKRVERRRRRKLRDQELKATPLEASRRKRLLSPTFTLHHLTGYALVPILGHHAYTHRLLPASLKLSPTLFSYSFTSYSLSRSARTAIPSAIAYATLTGMGLYHALVGMRILIDPTAPRSLRALSCDSSDSATKKARKQAWRTGYIGLVTAVGLGAARLATEGALVPAWMGSKYDVVLRGSGLS